jgi:hypothetical protein
MNSGGRERPSRTVADGGGTGSVCMDR